MWEKSLIIINDSLVVVNFTISCLTGNRIALINYLNIENIWETGMYNSNNVLLGNEVHTYIAINNKTGITDESATSEINFPECPLGC